MPERSSLIAAAVAVVAAVVIPAAAVAQWHHLAARHPVAAAALLVGWLALCGLAAAGRKAFAGPAQRRLEQAGNAADREVGLRLSRYGRRYRQWVLDSRRYIDVKDLATGGDHTPKLDDVYVDLALVSSSPHKVPASPIGEVTGDATARYSISEFLAHAKPEVLAILGPPGCGKSTLLAHVARQAAQAGRGQRRRVPVLLPLREQMSQITADPFRSMPEIARAAVSAMPGEGPAGWWERQPSARPVRDLAGRPGRGGPRR